VRDYTSIVYTNFQAKQSLPSEELAKLTEHHLIDSQLAELDKITK
jgi:hypothetical protein